MKIRRTYKETSLKYGQVEILVQEKMREIFFQTDIYIDNRLFSQSGYLKVNYEYSGFALLKNLLAGGKVAETFFSKFEFVSV